MHDEKKSLHDWESAVDKQIREAMERGEFDHLPGAGKPLDLGDNPFTPEEWRLAFKILKDNNVAPEWIEQSKDIRQELNALSGLLEQQAAWQREQLQKIQTLPPDKMRAEQTHLAEAREKTCRTFRQRADALNKLIDTFNLQVPNVNLQIARMRIDETLGKFIDACQLK